ncbi:hypothetical protein DSO57_1009580 [Entomophthora muscae]|uniref:Uncharacterized protein n=1 Tax=Entomophthora muscae TaxID=34485 RepID=A0ACC2TUJ1_9FUNG|nr:hypothetical protein DSO57_1009580 [Entomophthora muscae]
MRFVLALFGLCAGQSLVSWRLPGVIELNQSKGRAAESGFGLKEFMATAQHVVEQSVRGVTLSPVMCNEYFDPRSYGTIPCFGVAGGDLDKVIRKSLDVPASFSRSVHSPNSSLFNLVYLVEGDAIKAKSILQSGVDFVTLVLDGDSRCDIAYHPVEALAATIIGPGAVSITEAHARTVTHGWRVGAKASMSTSALVPIGSLDIGISTDYQGSIARTTSKTVKRDFKANLGSTCTPSLLRVSAFCKGTRAHVLYGKNTRVVTEKITTIQSKLLPNEANNGEFFTSIVGCIDYTQ